MKSGITRWLIRPFHTTLSVGERKNGQTQNVSPKGLKKNVKLFLIMALIALASGGIISFIDQGASLFVKSLEDSYIREAMTEAGGKPATDNDVAAARNLMDFGSDN